MNHASFVPFAEVDLHDGFWHDRYRLNKEVSLCNVRKRFEESGRFDALRFQYLKNGRKPHVFYDSDVAKWMEAVAYLAQKDPDSMAEHLSLCEELIDCMERAQRPDGYLNSEHQQIHPELIFRDRNRHELYCAGHLIEAAVAYHIATGKDRFLSIIERYCDCIYRAFIRDKTAGFVTPGHEEIEQALYTLYRHTKNKKYREMAEFFLSNRGRAEEEMIYRVGDDSNRYGSQDDVDIEHLEEANGHCVRALYLYAGVADMAEDREDAALLEHLDRVFDDICKHKMYITGGIGSTHVTESFTKPYDLPNMTAYSESCCAIAMMRFVSRLRRMKKRATYGHMMERVLYNSMLSSTTLDGKAFFYENPLEIALEEYEREIAVPAAQREHLPITQRVEVFDCSCCPPNINRFFAELGGYICVEEANGACVEQFISSDINSRYGTLHIRERYAHDGIVTISSSDYRAKTLSFRIPAWSREMDVILNGAPITPTVCDGYAEIAVSESLTLSLNFHIAPRFTVSNPCVRANVGRMALTRGPFVYALEGVDNGERLNQISVSPTALSGATLHSDFHGFDSIVLDAFRDRGDEELYFDITNSKKDAIKATFIPYFAFANRGESDLLVWVRRATAE